MTIKVLISSHCKYTTPLHHLMTSLVSDGVPLTDIIVVMAGNNTDSIQMAEQGYTVITSKRNLHELTSMAEIAQYWALAVGSQDAHIVALHDTSLVLPGFWEAMQETAKKMKSNNTDVTWLCKCKMYNMVMGNYSFFTKLADQYADVHELSKYEAWQIEVKKHPQYQIEMSGTNIDTLPEPQVYCGLIDIYSTGTVRMKALLPSAHICKFFCLNNFEQDPHFSHPLTA